MYYSNLGYAWGVPWPVGHGVCISAWGVSAATAHARDNLDEIANHSNRFFDPQLYLSNLEYPDCGSAVRRLSTYSWINPEIPPQEDGESNTNWEERVINTVGTEWPLSLPTIREEIAERSQFCVDFQIDFGVRAILLPSPLTIDQESDYSQELMWLDEGLKVIPDGCDLPIYATFAISDNCLIHRTPTENDLLQTIIDQITAREVDGVYLVIEQSGADDSPYIRNRNVAWSALSICRDIGVRAEKDMIVNYLNTFGLPCLSAGADIFISGPTNRARRLCLSDYLSRGGGGALPRFHSNSMIVDLLPERDIENKIYPANLLRLLEQDRTRYSDSLLTSIANGSGIALVPEWRESRNNRAASDAHYQEIIINASNEINESANPIYATLEWLQNAERDASYLASRFEDDPLSFNHSHIAAWRSAFERFISQYNL